MNEDVTKDRIVTDLSDLSQDEREEAWEGHVRKQVNDLLDLFLAPSKDCNFNVTYRPVVKEVLESGPVFDETKIEAAKLILVFEFKEHVSVIH